MSCSHTGFGNLCDITAIIIVKAYQIQWQFHLADVTSELAPHTGNDLGSEVSQMGNVTRRAVDILDQQC